jgi:hypothetical protein
VASVTKRREDILGGYVGNIDRIMVGPTILSTIFMMWEPSLMEIVLYH